MPKKTDDTKNAPISFSLPAGARALLQELVDLQEVGGDRAEVIRHLVVNGLQGYVDRGRIGRQAKPPTKVPVG
jgi:hypothetical protein